MRVWAPAARELRPRHQASLAVAAAIFAGTSLFAYWVGPHTTWLPVWQQILVFSVVRVMWIPFAWIGLRELQHLKVAVAVKDELARVAAEDMLDRYAIAARAEEATARRLRDLHEAVAALEILYQPIVRLDTGAPVGFEALSRFRVEPYRTPDWWFAEAESLGVGVWAELAAVREAVKALPLLPADTYLSLNVSAATLAGAELQEVLSLCDATRLVLEVTEHEAVDDYDVLARAMAPITQAGARIAVDDLGSGQSSLHHVLQLAPSIVKIDRSLVAGLAMNDANLTLIASLVGFARAAGAEVVAEGIEDPAEQVTLRALDVRCGQGYLFSKPGRLEDLCAGLGPEAAA